MSSRRSRTPRPPLPVGRRHALGRSLRRVAAVLLVAVSALLLVLAARRPADPGVSVVAAARAIPVGATLAGDDLTLLRLPTAALPEGTTTRVTDLVGRRAAIPLGPRDVVTARSLSPAALLAGQRPGSVAVWVPLGDPLAAATVRAGDVVDVLSPTDGGVLAREVLVLQASSGEGGQGVLLALTSAQAAAVARTVGADLGGLVPVIAVHAPPG